MIFKKKLLIIGFGAVGKCTLPILLKHIDIPYSNITIIDFEDKRKILKPWMEKGVKYFQQKITPANLTKVLSSHVESGGLIIDLSWNIDCLELLNWCHDNKVLYINTSVEEWDPYATLHIDTPFKKSLYYKQMKIRNMISKWNDGSTTAVLDHGANPGLISHFVRQGLIDIAKKTISNKSVPKNYSRRIKRLIQQKDFAHLSMELGVKVIHISERDSQISKVPKDIDEFVGTWSIEGLREEATAPVEIGWGTHEGKISLPNSKPPYGPKNQIFFSQMGMNTWVRSYVPHSEIIGMVIRHAEAFSISERLTVWKNRKAIYRPSVYYAYMACDETMSSLHELRARNYELQSKQRIMSDEIIKGEDALGALIMGHKYNSWWTGSCLSIEESRRLVPNQNATTVQVAIGVVSAIVWMLENQNKGVCIPDDLPYEYILNIAKPYLGKFISEPFDWTPFKNYQIFFKENPKYYLDKENIWSIENFLFKD
mgnify:CR=1 FL=1